MYSRVFHWGTDNIRYVKLSKGSPMAKHWVSPHVRLTPLKKKETIEKYRKKGWAIYREGTKIIGSTYVIAHIRGKAKTSNWDGTYNFGKKGLGPYSQMAISWLKHIEDTEGIVIQHAESGGELRLPLGDTWINLDGWCEETNTAYEFHGDVWHGNPKLFSSGEFCHPHSEMTAGELYEKTLQREKDIVNLGINLVTIWEYDWIKSQN